MKLQLDNHCLEYELVPGNAPCVVFCPGFNSTMQGNKAMALKAFCVENKLAFIRFDYSGHGNSGGEFGDSCISTWLADTLAIIDRVATDKVVIVGSSMGAWIALLASLRRPTKVMGLLLLACAADMTRYYPKRLKGLSANVDSQSRVFYLVPNQYGNQKPYSIYQNLINDGEQHFILDSSIELDIPVRLIHGLDDNVVEWQRSKRVLDCLSSSDASLLKITKGDHRLSTPDDLDCVLSVFSDLISTVFDNECPRM